MNDQTRLYVANIDFRANEQDVLELFKTVGEVNDVAFIMDNYTRRFKGFGFVEMASPELALQAIEALNGATILERAIVVRFANPKKPREERRGGFNRPRGGEGRGYGRNDRNRDEYGENGGGYKDYR